GSWYRAWPRWRPATRSSCSWTSTSTACSRCRLASGRRACRSRWSSRTPWPATSARSATRPASGWRRPGRRGTRAGAKGRAWVEEGGVEEMPQLEPGPREGQREAVQARALLEKAQRLLERAQPEDRPEVERLMERVRVALTDRKWDQLKAATNDLADTLFYLED